MRLGTLRQAIHCHYNKKLLHGITLCLIRSEVYWLDSISRKVNRENLIQLLSICSELTI